MASQMLTPQQMVRALGMAADREEWRKDLRRTYGRVGRIGAQLGRAELRSSPDQQLVAAARGVRGASNSSSAYIAVASGRAAAAIYGTKGPTGWLAHPRYAGTGARNNPPWIGQAWSPAVAGEGPRGINDALAAGMDRIIDEFEQAATDLIDRVFR